MKLFVLILTAIFICRFTHAETIDIDWIVDENTFTHSTCTIGEDVLLPETPYKYGYTFQGWFGYTPVEYLQSSGTQYIDTGIKGTDILKTNIIIQITSGFVKSDQKLFGFSERGNCGMFFTSFNGFYRGTNIPISTSKTEIEIIRTDIVANTFEATVLYDNNSFVTNSWWAAGRGTIDTFPIFAAVSGGAGIMKSVYRCYGLRLYDRKDQLIRDMIPVLDMNNIACMYDKITKQCFYNAGTGSFITGPIITE